MNTDIVLWAVKLEGRRLLKNGTGAPTVWTKQTQAQNQPKKSLGSAAWKQRPSA
jgi:hypothetical protein